MVCVSMFVIIDSWVCYYGLWRQAECISVDQKSQYITILEHEEDMHANYILICCCFLAFMEDMFSALYISTILSITHLVDHTHSHIRNNKRPWVWHNKLNKLKEFYKQIIKKKNSRALVISRILSRLHTLYTSSTTNTIHVVLHSNFPPLYISAVLTLLFRKQVHLLFYNNRSLLFQNTDTHSFFTISPSPV